MRKFTVHVPLQTESQRAFAEYIMMRPVRSDMAPQESYFAAVKEFEGLHGVAEEDLLGIPAKARKAADLMQERIYKENEAVLADLLEADQRRRQKKAHVCFREAAAQHRDRAESLYFERAVHIREWQERSEIAWMRLLSARLYHPARDIQIRGLA